MKDIFSYAVSLFRHLTNGQYDGNGAFFGELCITDDLKSMICKVAESGDFPVQITQGSFYFNSDVDDVQLLSSLIVAVDAQIEVSIPQTERGHFFSDKESFLNRHSYHLTLEILDRPFFIVADNICSINDPSGFIDKAKEYCSFLLVLQRLANYHDNKARDDLSYRLVFVVPDKDTKGFKTLVLETKFELALFALAPPDYSILTRLLQEAEDRQHAHALDKLSIFKICFVDVLLRSNDSDTSFSFLVEKWNDLLDSYQKSWENYLSGFSFHKLRSELAEQQTTYAQKLTDVISGLTGKLLTIPLSIGTLTFLDGKSTLNSLIIYFVASLVVVYIVRSSIVIQQVNVKNISGSFKIALGKINDLHSSGNPTIAAEIKGIRGNLEDVCKRINNTLFIYQHLSWFPLLALSAYLLFLNWSGIQSFYCGLMALFFDAI
jgi:hypothetical protein